MGKRIGRIPLAKCRLKYIFCRVNHQIGRLRTGLTHRSGPRQRDFRLYCLVQICRMSRLGEAKHSQVGFKIIKTPIYRSRHKLLSLAFLGRALAFQIHHALLQLSFRVLFLYQCVKCSGLNPSFLWPTLGSILTFF